MGPTEIQLKIKEKIPGADVQVVDLTGTSDHWQVTVISEAFRGKPMLEQHRLVKGFFEADIATGALHAFSLKTYTPEEWQKKKN